MKMNWVLDAGSIGQFWKRARIVVNLRCMIPKFHYWFFLIFILPRLLSYTFPRLGSLSRTLDSLVSIICWVGHQAVHTEWDITSLLFIQMVMTKPERQTRRLQLQIRFPIRKYPLRSTWRQSLSSQRPLLSQTAGSFSPPESKNKPHHLQGGRHLLCQLLKSQVDLLRLEILIFR